MAPAGEISLDAAFERDEPKLVEAGGSRTEDVALGDIAERFSPPEDESLAKSRGGRGRSPVLERAGAVRRQPLEPVEIKALRRDPEQIPGVPGLDALAPEGL